MNTIQLFKLPFCFFDPDLEFHLAGIDSSDGNGLGTTTRHPLLLAAIGVGERNRISRRIIGITLGTNVSGPVIAKEAIAEIVVAVAVAVVVVIVVDVVVVAAVAAIIRRVSGTSGGREIGSSRFSGDPELVVLGDAGGGFSIVAQDDLEGWGVFLAGRERGETGTGRGQTGEDGTELGLEVDGGVGGLLLHFLGGSLVIFDHAVEGGVDITGRDLGHLGHVEGVAFQGVVGADGEDDDGDGGDGAFEELGLDGSTGVGDPVADFGVPGLTDGVVEMAHGEESGLGVDSTEIEDLMDADGQKGGERGT